MVKRGSNRRQQQPLAHDRVAGVAALSLALARKAPFSSPVLTCRTSSAHAVEAEPRARNDAIDAEAISALHDTSSHSGGSGSDPLSVVDSCSSSCSGSEAFSFNLAADCGIHLRRRKPPWRTKTKKETTAMMGSCALGSTGASSIADYMSEVFRRNSFVVPLGCSSLSAHGSGHVSDVDPTAVDEGNNGLGPTKHRQKRVLIMMSDTGGGHRASAEALKSAFELEYGTAYKVFVIDLWKDHTPWPFNQLPKSYSFLVKNEYLWKFAFHVTAPRLVHELNFTTTGTFIAREMGKAFSKYQPDVIVSVHPLMQHVPLRILRSRGLIGRIPFTTVITDLNSCHPTWFHKQVTLCFAPNQDVNERALKAGLKPSQIRVHGLPIRPDFALPIKPKEKLREDLGMDQFLKAVILVGGGEGMGPVEATARALAEELARHSEDNNRPIGQLIVICGRNRRLAGALQSVDWPIPVQVKGFVSNMSEWMGACDCIITKAGPGTIAESLIRGLPMILNDFIAGQEAGNIPFVVDNGAGIFIKDPKEIAKKVRDWFGPRIAEFKSMAQNCLKLARPNAVFEIVRDLHDLAQRKAVVERPQLAIA